MDELILAKSKAGHDKNHIYVVMEKQEDVVYLVNGTTKTCANPKKKKAIQINDTLVGEILDLYNRRNEINV